jgi:hypothetical protein
MTKRQKNNTRRMLLKKETLRQLDVKMLDAADLAQIVGGGCKYSCQACTQGE